MLQDREALQVGPGDDQVGEALQDRGLEDAFQLSQRGLADVESERLDMGQRSGRGRPLHPLTEKLLRRAVDVDEAAVEFVAGDQARQRGPPLRTVFDLDLAGAAFQLDPLGVIVVKTVEFAAEADVLGTDEVAVVLQPVGIDQAWRIVVVFLADRAKQCFGAGHGRSP
jgi:hypothetical protein